MKKIFNFLFIVIFYIPIFAFSTQDNIDFSNNTFFQEEAWNAFEKNDYAKAADYQLKAIDFSCSEEHTYKEEGSLKMESDLTLFLSNILKLDSVIIYSNIVSQRLNNNNLDKTKSGYLHSARMGFYYSLAENITLADSLTQIGFDNYKSLDFTPKEQLELLAYRAVYYLSKIEIMRYLDYDNYTEMKNYYTEYTEMKNYYTEEAKKIIDEGINIAKANNIETSIFNRYLLSLKERILIGKIKSGVFIPLPYSDIETNFKLCNNTEMAASYKLKVYCHEIMENIKNGGQIVESLKYLESLAQISNECRGNTTLGVALYSLISDLYLELFNFPQATYYARMAFNIDKEFGENAYKDSKYHSERLNRIQFKYKEYENVKSLEPLYAFEHALMNQGSIKAQDALFQQLHGGENEYDAIGSYLLDGYNLFDFDKLINELVKVNGNLCFGTENDIQPIVDYKINPFIYHKTFIIRSKDPWDSEYYKILANYSPTLEEAKTIIDNTLNATTNLAERSIFNYYLAKYYFYKENIDKAISAQREHLKIELQLSNINYTDNALSAQKTLALLCMAGIWKALSSNEIEQAERYKNLFIEIGWEYTTNLQKYIEEKIPILEIQDQKTIWNQYANWFYNTIPYMGMSNKAAECIYNSNLFSKGLLLKAAKGEISSQYWRDIQNELEDGDLAIEFVNFRNINGYEIYYAVTITKDCEFPSINPIFSDFELKDLNILDEQIYLEPQMYDLIIRPIEISKEIKNIYFSPSGILHTIAIENLIDSLGQRTCEKWNMYRLSSTKELIHQRSHHSDSYKKKAALILGDLDYDYNLTPSISTDISKSNKHIYDRYKGGKRARVEALKYSRPEIDSIASLTTNYKLHTILLTGKEGTEERFKYETENPLNIIHFSTHGFFYSEKEIAEDGLESDKRYSFLFKEKSLDSEDLAMTRSALVMTGGNNTMRGIENFLSDCEDGLLTAMEISNLSLKHCDMVTLSACETALGEVSNEGVFGLQRGFKLAGVNTILMSLWKVDDEATQILMTEFYKNYLTGMSKCQALREAQKSVREIPDFSSPEYWASFILLDALN